ncbi:hypothetical protein EIJ81_00890 (plasmid) [Aliivibrio salmonicida]|uniref:hypothetical protein n=1 Tax=Aliivibrio salmonicida TaxID=40269 RepID=UPI000F6DEEFB|nr:hypothetical protein [Aliivibrio salmonicida]AZL83456.1 hypothetical protein EIJ81_00890 [Aliivibrio salmonicida]
MYLIQKYNPETKLAIKAIVEDDGVTIKVGKCNGRVQHLIYTRFVDLGTLPIEEKYSIEDAKLLGFLKGIDLL